MTLLRSPEQAKLAELYAVGGGLLMRYRDPTDNAGEHLQAVLADTIAQRVPLLERVREAEQARGDIPPAADHEINQIRIVTDRVLASLLGEHALATRLVRGEEAWLTLIEEARGMDWADDERTLLEDLAAGTREAIQRLRAAA